MFSIKSFSIFVILFSVISLIIIFTIPRLKKKQKNVIQSLQEGYGYYGKEESLGCFSLDGKCTDSGVETIVQYCKPHPATGRGCFRNNKMTYETIVRKKPCRLQCYSSDFLIQDGIQVTNPTEVYDGTSFINTVSEIGCNKIIDKRYGVDYTNYFLGNLFSDDDGNKKYLLNYCIPNGTDSEYQGYYERIFSCVEKDDKGESLCNYTCGNEKGKLIFSGINKESSGDNTLIYYPYEINTEGQKIFYCYDLDNKNQVELLNYTDEIPEDFVYPEICYKHVNVFDFNEKLWPNTNDNTVFNLTKDQISRNVSYIDILPDQYSKFDYITTGVTSIISRDYELNKDSESYVKLRFGNELAILDKIYDIETTGIDVKSSRKTNRDDNNIESKFMYLALTGENKEVVSNGLKSGINTESDFAVKNENGESVGYTLLGKKGQTFYNNNLKIYQDQFYFEDSNNLYFPCDLSDLFDYSSNRTNIIYNGVSTIIQNDSITTSGTSYYYMVNKGVSLPYNQVKFLKGVKNASSSSAYFEGDIFDEHNNNLESLYVYNNRAPLIDDKIIKVAYNGDHDYSIDLSKSFMTFNVLTKELQDRIAGYDFVEIVSNEEINLSDKNKAYSVLGSPVKNGIQAYYYPLYLSNDDNGNRILVKFSQFPKVDFYQDRSDTFLTLTKPEKFQNKTIAFFNDEILFSSATFETNYINLESNKKYFISELNTVNHGMCYFKTSDDKNNVYPLFSSVGSSFNNLTDNVTTEKIPVITSAISYKGGGNFEGSRTIKLVRGNSLLVKSLQTNPFSFSSKMEKVRLYYEMLRNQDFAKNYKEDLIFEPEKYLSIEADFGVFKSPYVFNSDGSKNFFCYKDNGTPLPNGTVVNFNTSSSDIYLNLTCPNNNITYQVAKVDRDENKVISLEDPYCGVKGIEQDKDLNVYTEDKEKVLGFCVQDIDAVQGSFTSDLKSCNIIKDKNNYNSLNSQLETGIRLIQAKKSYNFNEGVNEGAMTFPSYFTRIFKPHTLYLPGEDFFFEKSRDDYYYSTINNNLTFFDNFTNWREILPYSDNILVSPFQYFFNIFPKKNTDSLLSVGLGKFSDTFTGLKKIDSMNLYSSFNSSNYGITTQNYLNYGIMPYWGNQIKTLRKNKIRGAPRVFPTFMRSLQNSLFRRNYDSNTFTSGQPKPEWANIKVQDVPDGLQYNFTRGSPIEVFFSFVKTDDGFLFSSRFYDVNLNFPWASDVEVGDFFNPDLIYFNFFFYTFILFATGSYGINFPGNGTDEILWYDVKGIFYDNFLLKEKMDDPVIFTSINKFRFKGPLVNNSINVYESSLVELSDFILFLPIRYYTERTNVKLIYDSKNFPNTYPTFEIRRVSNITENIPNTDGKKTIFFEEKNYSSTNPSQITSETEYYLFNLGKSSGYNDLISRNFRIVRTGDFNYTFREGGTVNTETHIKKKYIEFFFSIESISQEKMSLLYEKYVTDIGKFSISYPPDYPLPSEVPDDLRFSLQVERLEFNFLTSYQNVMTPALSARYIKSEVKVPSQVLFGNAVATLSNTTSQDILNTKVMSMTTKFKKLGKFYYISEFRENSDYFTPTVDRVFEIGDTFKYYNLFFRNQPVGPISGSKDYFMTLELRVVDVNVTLLTNDGENLTNIYDYKCVHIDKNFNYFKQYGKRSFGNSETSEIYQGEEPISSGDEDGDVDFEYQLPYTGWDTSTGLHSRVTVLGITNDLKIKCKDNNTETTVLFEKNNLFLDYYKFRDNKVGTHVNPPRYGTDSGILTSLENLASKDQTVRDGVKRNLKISTIYSGNAIRAGLLDFMVLSSTTVKADNNNSETYTLDVQVVGKPYGTECFISEPASDSVPSYEGFGKIKNFSLSNQVFPAGTTLRSSKGIQIKVIGKEPSSYNFLSVVSPYTDISLYSINYSYAKQEIVTFRNLNKRQYFRNNSPFVLPYIENPDPSNVNVPYAVKEKDTNTWFYPLFVKSKEGREEIKTIDEINFFYSTGELYNIKGERNTTQYMDYSFSDEEKIIFLESFSPVSRTIYPEDNFLQYNSEAIYTLGQIVITKVNNVNTLFKSLKEINVGNPVSDLLSWEIVLNFENFITEDYKDFYSKLIPSSDYTNYINDLKNINNQHLPALISKYNGDEFCPQPCSYYDTQTNYDNTFLGTSYFKDIKYIFENPIILNVDGTSTVVSLSNSPLESPQQYILDFDVNFFQNGGGRNNVLSQYLYFINIQGQEKKYGKNLCTGDLFVTKETGPSINTGIDKFTFSNSLLFNFIPCDEDGQDFIKYDIDPNYNSTTHGSSILIKSRNDYVLSSHENQFPPNGVSCNVLVSSKNGSEFRSVYGHFSHDYVVLDGDNTSTVTGSSFSLKNITRGERIGLYNFAAGLCYGDVWYNKVNNTESYTSGFVVPENSSGLISDRSFIYLTENKDNPISEIKFLEESPDVDVMKEQNKIRTFEIVKSPDYQNYTSKVYYLGEKTSIYLETLNGEPLQQNQSLFFTDDVIQEGEVLYLPTYDITKNIKVKSYSVFGHNFLGDISYSVGVSESHYSLEGEKLSPTVFSQSKNDLLRSDRINEGVNLFTGSENRYTPSGEKVFLINFEGEKFSIKPNLYTKPIVNKDSKLLYLENTTINPTLPLAAIDTENTDTFITKGLSNIKGLSIHLNFNDYLNFNTNYSSDGTEIPGETNIQLQLREIRQNYLDYYIQENDNCSLYFQPPVGLRIDRQEAVKIDIKISNSGYYNSYNNTIPGDRFFGTFKNSKMFFDFKKETTLELGCNLLYLIDQTDGSNNEPMVFSKNTWTGGNFTNLGNTIDMGPPNKQTFVIKYFLDGENVSYDDYLAKGNFSNENNSVERLIEILYKSDFDINDTNNNNFKNANIYYGTPEKGINIGGKLHFNYH